MNFNNTVIAGLGHHLPETVLTSDAIEDRLAPLYERLKLPFGRLELMTGIKERRVWPKGTRPSELSTNAANALFNETNFPKEEVDLLIHSSVCRDFLEPSTASVVHANLGLSSHAMIFDLSNACLGVVNAMVVASHMIERGQISSALIVSGENGGPLVEETINHLLNNPEINRKNIKKYIANLTIGSAATAILLTKKELFPNAPRIIGGSVMTDSKANVLCQGDGNPNQLMMETDSEALLKAGTELAQKNWALFQENLKWDKPDWIIGHQVGKAHEELTTKAMGLSNIASHITYPYFGNTGSSALPLTLMKLLESSNKPKKGERLALLGIGSGLTSIMLGVEF